MPGRAPITATSFLKYVDVVKAIQASPTGQRGPYGTESLEPPIRVVKAYRRNH
jgi:hypothetical protein